MGCIKGSAMVIAVKTLRANKARARALLPPAFHKYLEDRILVSSWYPEEDNLELIRACSKILAPTGIVNGEDVYVMMGRVTVRDNMTKFYEQVISPGSPDCTLSRANSVWRVYHDTGSFVVTSPGAGRVRLELKDYCLPSSEMCRIRIGFYSELAIRSGAAAARTTEIECSVKGAPACILEIEWKEGQSKP